MSKYLSLVFLYNRASHKKLLLIAGVIPVGFLAIFFVQIGNSYNANPTMFMERAFGGIVPVLLFILVNLMAVYAVANSLNGKKSAKASLSTTGYTMRRLQIPPLSAYITIFIYYIAIILILWAVAIASLYAIAKIGLTMAGAEDVDIGLALGLLRTEIGHALLPIAHPTVIVFNAVSVVALAGQCARSCYLKWHNGTPSAWVILVAVLMLAVWINVFGDNFLIMILAIYAPYVIFTFGDVIFREKRPKGDPFKVNKYEGVLDYDSMEFDDDVYALEVNSLVGSEESKSLMEQYGRGTGKGKSSRRLSPALIRRRYMPLGINMEKANYLFGASVFMGVAEHFIFFFKYRMQLTEITGNIKGITIDSAAKMPYFCDLQAHTYYGYIIAILLVLFLQAYWNYEYYNKKTKSVYVMKRLPNQKEYSRTIWIAPIMQASFIAIIMIVHTVIDLCVYVFATPEIALYSDYLSHILPF